MNINICFSVATYNSELIDNNTICCHHSGLKQLERPKKVGALRF